MAGGMSAPVDLRLIAATWGGGEAGSREILHFFRSSSRQDALALQDALAARDLPELTRAAHRLLGACRMVGALDLGAECERISQAGRRQDWAGVLAALQPFEAQLRRLDEFVDHLVAAP